MVSTEHILTELGHLRETVWKQSLVLERIAIQQDQTLRLLERLGTSLAKPSSTRGLKSMTFFEHGKIGLFWLMSATAVLTAMRGGDAGKIFEMLLKLSG